MSIPLLTGREGEGLSETAGPGDSEALAIVRSIGDVQK